MQVDIDTLVLLNDFSCLAQNSKVCQTEEVHLQKSNLGYIFHAELGHDGSFTIGLAGSL